jgi:DNA polymerase III epsilon subunit-like protein
MKTFCLVLREVQRRRGVWCADTCFHFSRKATTRKHPRLPSTSTMRVQCTKKTRLDADAERAVAIDVEYMHIRLVHVNDLNDDAVPRYEKFQLPSDVCLVNVDGDPLVLSKIDSLTELLEMHPWCRAGRMLIQHDGGCLCEDMVGQPLLSNVRETLIDIVKDRLVVGHNITKDLSALGITEKHVPVSRRRDTMRYPQLQNEKGCGRALAELAQVKLGRKIQQCSPHDPMEDACATMELYMKYCHYDESLMEYDDLVEYYLSQIITSHDESSTD